MEQAPKAQFPSSLRHLRLEGCMVDLCATLAGCQLPAHCTVCVAIKCASPLAEQQVGGLQVISRRLGNLGVGAHQLHIEAPKITLTGRAPPVLGEGHSTPAVSVAWYLGIVLGFQQLTIRAPVRIEHVSAQQDVGEPDECSHSICPDAHSLAAALGPSNVLCNVSIEKDHAVVDCVPWLHPVVNALQQLA